MPTSAMLAAAIAGAIGGLHCAAMCGGWVMALSRGHEPRPLLPARTLAIETAASHAGRIATYVLVGALLGGAGGATYAVAWSSLQRPLYVFANVMLLVLAVSLARATFRGKSMERAGLFAFRRLLPLLTKLSSRRRTLPIRFVLGSVWGATPCALIYSVLPVALLSGSAGDGALIMLAFGVGTLPNLLVAGFLLRRPAGLFRTSASRLIAGAVVGSFALYGMYRALWLPASLGDGPYCWLG